MSHEWKIGDWCECDGRRCIVTNVLIRNGEQWIYGSGVSPCDFSFETMMVQRVKYLPECTGWDWEPPKPIEPPEGYRLLGNDEMVLDGDVYLHLGEWKLSEAAGGNLVCSMINKLKHEPIEAYARKIEPQCETTEAVATSAAKSDIVGTGLVLIPWYSILAIGKIFIEGLRYGRDNWKKGVGDKAYQEERLEHAMLHLLKWKEGDRTEAHLEKVAWFCVTQLELERLEQEKH